MVLGGQQDPTGNRRLTQNLDQQQCGFFLWDLEERGAQVSPTKLPQGPNPAALRMSRPGASWAQPPPQTRPRQAVVGVGVLSLCMGHTDVSTFQTPAG